MTRLFDTHCHFETANAGEIAALLARAKAAGVEKLMAVGGSPTLNASAMMAFSEGRKKEEGRSSDIPEVIYAVGLDRDQATSSQTPPLTFLPHGAR